MTVAEVAIQCVEAIHQHRCVHITHTKATGEESTRQILPYYLVKGRVHTYVHAYCCLRRSKRSFRLDRITHISKGNTVQGASVYKVHSEGLCQEPAGEILASVLHTL